MWVVLMVLFRVFINFLVFLLVFGYNGVILWCLNFNCFVNCLNLKFWNGGLLFVFSFFGILNNEKILLNRGIIDLVDVDCSIFIIGYFEWLFIIINRYFFVGNGL